jgi:hypothetical protein
MPELSWAGTTPPILMFQIGIRICDHFALGMSELSHDDLKKQYDRFDLLNKHMSDITDNLDLPGYVDRAGKFLAVFQGESVCDAVREALTRHYDYDERLKKLNEIAFDQVRKCVGEWGGRGAADRLESLEKLPKLPLVCGPAGGKAIECSFDREGMQINIGAGLSESLLNECMIFEFTLFHEYLSHVFPDWQKDEPEVSEAWLFALELQWFKHKYTALDTDLLVQVWEPRLRGDRDPFRVAEWLLGRCDSRKCVATFILNLVSSWESLGSKKGSEFLSSLIGAAMKTGLKSGGHGSDKQQNTFDLIEKLLCSPCKKKTPSWDLEQMHGELKQEISKYGLKI